MRDVQTHAHTHAHTQRAHTHTSIATKDGVAGPTADCTAQTELLAIIWKSYLVLFEGPLLLHMRTVLSRHHSFDVCHWHCDS